MTDTLAMRGGSNNDSRAVHRQCRRRRSAKEPTSAFTMPSIRQTPMDNGPDGSPTLGLLGRTGRPSITNSKKLREPSNTRVTYQGLRAECIQKHKREWDALLSAVPTMEPKGRFYQQAPMVGRRSVNPLECHAVQQAFRQGQISRATGMDG